METRIFTIEGFRKVYYRKRHLKIEGVGINRLYRIFKYKDISYPDVLKDEFQRIWLSQNVIDDIMEYVINDG